MCGPELAKCVFWILIRNIVRPREGGEPILSTFTIVFLASSSLVKEVLRS